MATSLPGAVAGCASHRKNATPSPPVSPGSGSPPAGSDPTGADPGAAPEEEEEREAPGRDPRVQQLISRLPTPPPGN